MYLITPFYLLARCPIIAALPNPPHPPPLPSHTDRAHHPFPLDASRDELVGGTPGSVNGVMTQRRFCFQVGHHLDTVFSRHHPDLVFSPAPLAMRIYSSLNRLLRIQLNRNLTNSEPLPTTIAESLSPSSRSLARERRGPAHDPPGCLFCRSAPTTHVVAFPSWQPILLASLRVG